MKQHPELALAGIGLLGILCQWLAWRLKLPAILFLLLVGALLGPVFGWLDPDALFGHLLFPIVALSVAVILFEGSLTLRWEEIRGLERVVRNLITIGTAISSTTTAIATHYLLGFSWEVAFLFGALMVVTGPTVIIPMLRTVRPTTTVANVLRWEGIVIDPLGALLTVIVFNLIVSAYEAADLGKALMTFAQMLLTGFVLGGAAGYLLGLVLRRHWLADYLRNAATLNLVLGVFVLANEFEHESGLLAVTVMGITLANHKGAPVKEILDFKETLSLLLISALFIILAARIELTDFEQLGWGALGVLAIMQFVGRPAKVFIAALGSSLNWRERALIAWVGPRGIVAAAIAAIFALRLSALGHPEAELMVPLAFSVIIGTVVLQSATARPLASLLGVAEPEPTGFLIIGANPVARAVGKALTEHGFNVLLTDTGWENVRAARMQGLPIYYGNPVSEHADRHLELVGIGRMLGLSYVDDLNALAAMRYRAEFGTGSIFALQSTNERIKVEKHSAARKHRGRTLFGEDVTYATLADLLEKGAKIRSTPLTEKFGYSDLYKQARAHLIPLFAISPRGELRIFSTDRDLEPQARWTVLSISESQEQKNRPNKTRASSKE
jgi:CPA1 family monovalent cation:H+ antiporter